MAASRNSAGINKSGGKNVNPLYKAAKSVTSYIGNVAREVRDIPTAVGTNFEVSMLNETKKRTGTDYGTGPSGKNLVKQIGEVSRALATGKKGTSSDVSGRKTGTGFLGGDVTFEGYKKGKKRK